jgi:hypothetical protein
MKRAATGLLELGRSMFALTPGERKALCLVLALALLGLGVKAWHSRPSPLHPATQLSK